MCTPTGSAQIQPIGHKVATMYFHYCWNCAGQHSVWLCELVTTVFAWYLYSSKLCVLSVFVSDVPAVSKGEAAVNGADLSKDDARDFIAEKFGPETLTGITNNVWKTRLEALTTIQEGLGSLILKADGAKVCLSLCHVPGWKDSNFQVRKPFPSQQSVSLLVDCHPHSPEGHA